MVFLHECNQMLVYMQKSINDEIHEKCVEN